MSLQKLIEKEDMKNNFLDTITDLENEKEQIDFKIDAELRKQGWMHSSSHPGSLWLWSKKIGNKTYHVPRETAIYIEKSNL